MLTSPGRDQIPWQTNRLLGLCNVRGNPVVGRTTRLVARASHSRPVVQVDPLAGDRRWVRFPVSVTTLGGMQLPGWPPRDGKARP